MQFKKLALTLSLALIGANAHAATDITFWHSMEGPLGDKVKQITDDFNKAHPEFKVNPVYKGSYMESMNAGIAAYRAGQSPDIIQVFEVGTATMMYSKGAIKPVSEMSEEVKNPIDVKAFVSGVASYYSKDGKLVSMPFNSSTPVLFYNKDLFTKAGLDPNKAPKTYEELDVAAKKLKAAGVECAYTTAWPSWVLLENFASIHNVPFATGHNGFDGLNSRLALNSEAFKKHLTFLNNMAKEGTFTYGGRADNATGLFTSGKCAIYTGSSGTRATVEQTAKFKYGISTLPYYKDAKGAPQNSVIGGASLWVFSKKTPEVYKGITEFFKYLASPEVAASWHQDTGYVPVVNAAYELSKKQGYYEKNPGTDIAIKQLSADSAENSIGLRLGFMPQIRDVEEADMEDIFAQKKTVDEGLADMEKRGNALLERFEKANSH